MSFGYDPEVPAGFQDADIEQAAYEAQGARLAQLRREGKCAHGWRQGYTAKYRPDLKPGQVECHDCGKIADEVELDDEREALGFGRFND